MFEGKYYNRHISKGMPAVITLEPKGIRIRYMAGEEAGEVFWHLSEINKSEFNDATTLLTYGKHPKQSLSVFEQNFESALKEKYPGAAFLKSTYSSFLKSGVTGVIAVGVLALCFLVVVIFWAIPALADKLATQFPPTYERQLGEQLYKRLISSYEVDEEKTKALNEYLDHLQVKSDFDITATVVESNEVNAFAVPGGFVVVHEGILNKMERHEELAGLLGHELAHVQLRHSTRSLMRSLSYYMLLSVLFGDLSGVSAVIIDNASTLRNLEYSRSLETEADNAGLQLLRENHLNPEGMVWLLERLTHNGPEFVSFLSTHPDSKDRIKAIEVKIEGEEEASKPNPHLEKYWEELKR